MSSDVGTVGIWQTTTSEGRRAAVIILVSCRYLSSLDVWTKRQKWKYCLLFFEVGSKPTGQRTWSHVSSSTCWHPKCRLWTTPSPTIFAIRIRIRIARQMAGWKTKNNNSSITESELWRNSGPSSFQLQETMLKTDKIWCAYLVANCVSLRTFWTPLVCCSDGVAAVISGLHAIFFIILGASLSLAQTFSYAVSPTLFEVSYTAVFICALFYLGPVCVV